MQHVAHRHSDEIHQLRAEIERLRALSQNNAHSWDAIVRDRDALRAALGFCLDIATEAYHELDKSVGMEVVLRHIMRKASETLQSGGAGECAPPAKEG